MSDIIGRQIEFGVGVETSRGTALANPTKWMRNVTANVVERAEKAVDDTTAGVLEDSFGSRVVKKFIEGDISGIVHADALGYLLENIYGASAATLVTGSVYDNVFTLTQSISHSTLSLFAKDGSAQQRVFNGGVVKTLELTATVDDFVRYSASFIAREGASNSSSPSYSAEYDFIGKDITVKFADTEGGLGAATAIPAKEISINWDTGATADHVLGAYAPNDIYNTKMTIEGEMTLNFANTTYKDLFLADTAKYAQIVIQGSADIGSGNNPTITILLNKVQVMEWGREGGSDDLVTQTVSFKAFYNRTDAQQSEVTLRNLTASY